MDFKLQVDHNWSYLYLADTMFHVYVYLLHPAQNFSFAYQDVHFFLQNYLFMHSWEREEEESRENESTCDNSL